MFRWIVIWICALIAAAVCWAAFERHWRSEGYRPTVTDSLDLWAQQRDDVVRRRAAMNVALIGASRIQYGLSPRAFDDEASRLGRLTKASMLAINGHYPLAALRDLSNDPDFTGLAIVGIDARGFQKIHREMQTKWIHYYHHDWTPAKSLHRHLLTHLQAHAISLHPDFAGSRLIARWVNKHGAPSREYVIFHANRSGSVDYTRSAINAVRDARVRDLRDYYAATPAITPQQWLADADEVIEWVRAINARGGRVVFYREPASGEHLVLDENRFPRPLFWDELAAKMPATMIEFRDHPMLMFDTPDTSHIDAKDIEAHTRNFVRTLAERGVLRGM
jgi:hypothetical protein